MKAFRAALLVVLSMLLGNLAAADVNRWTTNGPAADIVGVFFDHSTPPVLYAYSSQMLYKSTDGGATWDSGLPLPESQYRATQIPDPSSPGTLYRFYPDVFLYKSTDGGNHWAKVSIPGYLGLIYQFAVLATRPTTLLGSQCIPYNGCYVLRSTNGGATWTQKDTGSLGFSSFAASPFSPLVFGDGSFGGAAAGGIYKSVNGGQDWLRIGSMGFPGWFDPANPDVMYAEGGYVDVNGYRVFILIKSLDGGITWNSLPVKAPLDLVVAPNDSAALFGSFEAGVFRSPDGGATWASLNVGLESAASVLAIDSSGRFLYAGSPKGVYRLEIGAFPSASNAAFLPSSARAPGAGGAFYATDVTIANTGASDTQLTLKFLGNNKDGSGGAEHSFTLAAGRSTTYADILGSVFGETSNFGAVRIESSSPSFVVLGETSTAGFGGTFGQSVPAARPSDLISYTSRTAIIGVREDAAFRTNLILSNATSDSLDVDVLVVDDTGAGLGHKRYTLEPLGMTQVTRVVRDVGFSGDIQGAVLLLSTPTVASTPLLAIPGVFSAYASVIDNVTNDPRTLLPRGPIASPQSTNVWVLPSSARAPGVGGAFYTTDLTVSNTGDTDTTFALKFLGHDQDGTGGSEQTFALAAGKTATYADVLGSVFSQTTGYGAIRIASSSPALNILGQTSTPGFGGTFGQSVPASAPEDLVVDGSPRSLVAVRENAGFRTNVVLCNTTPASLDVDAVLMAADGTTLASKRYTLAPLGMTQVARVVRDMGVSGDVTGARLVLSTPTPGGAFAAYASAIDNTTNDPRTLLPR